MIINKSIMNDLSKRLQKLMDSKGLTKYELYKETSVSQPTLGRIITKGSKPSTKTKKLLSEYFQVDEIYFSELTDEQISNQLNKSKTPKPEGKLINEKDYPTKEVTIIPIKGRGGLENAYFDKLYIEKLDKESLTIKQASSNGSEWFKIEVEGVSMDDSTSDFEGSKYSLCEGDWAYCRSIPKTHWRNKLHFNSVKVFCFFHNTRGIIFKKVKGHDIENGQLTLCSLNKDKKLFPDFDINVGECSYICNVIKVLTEY